MNESSPQKTQTYDSWLKHASSSLKEAGIDSARLDAELILAHTIRKPRVYLHAHGDEILDERRKQIADARIGLRLDHTPIAYIIGHKDFYGRQFKTTPAALIPRVESEAMIDLLKDIVPNNLSLLPHQSRLVDVGTGTGCLGITAKLEWPELDVTLTDISTHALYLAKENAASLGADVWFAKANLLHGYTTRIDILLANLPYVDESWDVSPETNAEPQEALYAANEGLALIYQLIDQAAAVLKNGSHMLLESDTRQHIKLIEHATKKGFHHNKTKGLICAFTRA